ncbi:NAD-dependent epimerase/dehydratase family protein [Paraburkholderia phymatum]|uniref:NAD-dependent epimerase/dehydratase family protein n=1 Tax=Paraburkholderia phymatum TaxID=148447 RepID=UPI00317F48BF
MKATRNLRRPRVLIVGCGDVGMRCVRQLQRRARLYALTHHAERRDELRAAGVTPIVGDLDARQSLWRLAGLAPTVLHLAPPQKTGDVDMRTRSLIATLTTPRIGHARHAEARATGRLRSAQQGIRARKTSVIVPDGGIPALRAGHYKGVRPRIVYASTTGVYGDCGGAWLDETRPVAPANERAKRRVSAETQLRRAAARHAIAASIARIPGIYAGNRLPLARLERRTPALVDADDVYTNHIHADDLAAILLRMATHGLPSRVIHASDDTTLKMGEYFDRVADAFGVERAPRITRGEAQRQLEPMMLSFMRESRRLVNGRLKRELRVKLRYPSVDDFLRTVARRA